MPKTPIRDPGTPRKHSAAKRKKEHAITALGPPDPLEALTGRSGAGGINCASVTSVCNQEGAPAPRVLVADSRDKATRLTLSSLREAVRLIQSILACAHIEETDDRHSRSPPSSA